MSYAYYYKDNFFEFDNDMENTDMIQQVFRHRGLLHHTE